MSSNRDHDVEVGETATTTIRAAEIHHKLPRTRSYRNVTSIPAKMLDGSEQWKKDIRNLIPDDLELPAMTRILRNMVAANDLYGVTEVLTKMQIHEKSDGFTIQDVAGNGLLQIAALKNFDKMTELLLNEGFNINYVDDNHGTALQAAIYMDSSDVLAVLLKSRCSRIEVNTVGGYYGCALQVASFKGSSEYIDRLVTLGANRDVYIAESKYGTALQAAARTGLPSILTQILALDRTQINREGGTWGVALQAAAKGGYTEDMAKLLQLSRGRVLSQANEVDRKKATDRTDYLRVAAILLREGAEVNVGPSGRLQSPINAAASSGQYEMLKLLLENDYASEAERKQKYGRALLSAITQIFNPDRLPLVTELVSRGADINFVAGNSLYNRPLAAAAAMNDVTVVAYLLEVSKENKQEYMDAEFGIYGSALRAALSAPQPAKDTALHLINAGADITYGDNSYGNILHLAAFANLPEIVNVLLDKPGMYVDTLDKNYQTALHIAAYHGYEQVVGVLLTRNADANLKDVWGDIPLDIVGHVIGRESHPAPNLQGLRKIKEMLLKKSVSKNEQHICGPFPGPAVAKQLQVPKLERQEAKPVYESPKWNPGLKFSAKIVDFLEKDEREHILIKDLAIDDLLYKTEAIKETMDNQGVDYERKLRWIHLPANNMTWVEMLMKILWPGEYKNTTCAGVWGTDPDFASLDLAPHARFVTPQCGRLIQESTSETYLTKRSSCEGTLFFAMPYIHWESFSSQVEDGKILDTIKRDISRTKIWRSNAWQANENYSRQDSGDVNEPSPLPGSDDGLRGTRDAEGIDYDTELLKTYLYKRWPVHMRRTLDQYYYPYLADTKTRDCDQVVMRARQQKLQQEATFTAQYVTTESERDAKNRKKKRNWESKRKSPNSSLQTKVERPKADGNSPVVMVDQLWLWVVSPGLMITSFPRRKSAKQDGDLDPEDKTDVLRTLLEYLHSTKRAPINDAYDLCELVVSQAVEILHGPDIIPELNFLKIFATQTDRALDRVMTGLRDFVDSYKAFMKWLEKRHKDPDGYVRRFEEIVSVTYEMQLFQEIQRMKDELNMLSAVFRDQTSVLRKLGENIDMSRAGMSHAALLSKVGRDRGVVPTVSSIVPSVSAFSVPEQIEKHAGRIKRMQDLATQAHENLQDVLNFKQQQASVLEAHISQRQFITAAEQNRIIMVFTIVTIIFLPLTFITTIFSLPVLEFPRYDPSTLERSPLGNLKSAYVFPIISGFTLGCVILIIIAALNITLRQHALEKAEKFRKDIGQKFERFYWGGPSLRRHDRPNDI